MLSSHSRKERTINQSSVDHLGALNHFNSKLDAWEYTSEELPWASVAVGQTVDGKVYGEQFFLSHHATSLHILASMELWLHSAALRRLMPSYRLPLQAIYTLHRQGNFTIAVAGWSPGGPGVHGVVSRPHPEVPGTVTVHHTNVQDLELRTLEVFLDHMKERHVPRAANPDSN